MNTCYLCGESLDGGTVPDSHFRCFRRLLKEDSERGEPRFTHRADYMVIVHPADNPEGLPPNKLFTSYEAADHVAKKMAEKHRKRFFVAVLPGFWEAAPRSALKGIFKEGK